MFKYTFKQNKIKLVISSLVCVTFIYTVFVYSLLLGSLLGLVVHTQDIKTTDSPPTPETEKAKPITNNLLIPKTAISTTPSKENQSILGQDNLIVKVDLSQLTYGSFSDQDLSCNISYRSYNIYSLKAKNKNYTNYIWQQANSQIVRNSQAYTCEMYLPPEMQVDQFWDFEITIGLSDKPDQPTYKARTSYYFRYGS